MRTLVAVADLHGHRTLFDRLVARLDADFGDDYDLVTLGDYVDNGPEIPALLERLVELKRARPTRFIPIIGNHDLGCLRSIGWDGGAPDEAWFERWATWQNPGGETARAYRARSAKELAEKLPTSHRAFLQALPWSHVQAGHVFVHAGLAPGLVAPQLAELAQKPLPGNHWTIDALRDKGRATISDASWDSVVVSGHTKRPGAKSPGHPHAPHFATARRITLSAEVDETGVLYAVALPSRRVYRAAGSDVTSAEGLLS